MSKITGEFVTVTLDDSTGTPRAVSSDVEAVDIPDEYDDVEVTGFTDGSHNSIPGLLNAPVEITGMFNAAATTGLYTVLKGIKGQKSAHTLTVKVGQGAAPVNGDPEFEGEFWCSKMNVAASPSGKLGLTASLRVYGAVAPAWGVVS